jgi:sugar phosphate isomerase/epimerase
MKMSISNLSWGNTSIEIMAPKLSKIGINGIEIAPSTIWGDINKVTPEMVLSLRKILSVNNLDISGIQSLLFGHPEFQLFDKSSESAMLLHLQRIIEIGGLLGASVVVFGSPKNRVRGNLGLDESNELAAVFFRRLIPYLEA